MPDAASTLESLRFHGNARQYSFVCPRLLVLCTKLILKIPNLEQKGRSPTREQLWGPRPERELSRSQPPVQLSLDEVARPPQGKHGAA